MIKLRHNRHSLFLLVLAWVCAAGEVSAHENTSPPPSSPALLDHKEAAALMIHHPAPEYPPVAKVNYLQGQVRLELTIDRNGKVADAHVLKGNAILAASALKAVDQWTYHPLDTPAGPAGFVTKVKLNFFMSNTAPDLTPPEAERDLLRQIKPSRIDRPPQDAQAEDVVHMRLLVNDQGEVVDIAPMPTDTEKFAVARESLRTWTFHPAHWGTLPVASYVDVDVPVSAPSLARNTNSSNH